MLSSKTFFRPYGALTFLLSLIPTARAVGYGCSAVYDGFISLNSSLFTRSSLVTALPVTRHCSCLLPTRFATTSANSAGSTGFAR